MKKKVLIITSSLLLLSLYVWRVVYLNINSQGFRVETEVHEMNEVFIYNDFQYNMLSFEILNKSELEEKFDIDTDAEEDTKYLLAKFNVKYLGGENDKLTPLFYANFESGSWSNGFKSILLNAVNKEGMRFDNNQEKTLYVVSAMVSVQFSESEWKKADKRKFNLVLGTYPKKVEIKCY